MVFFDRKKLTAKEALPGISMQETHLEDLMITMVELSPSAVIPEHAHPHEQISYCVSGSLALTVDGETKNLGPGQGAAIASGRKHSAVTGPEGAFFIDSWSPVREDYIIY